MPPRKNSHARHNRPSSAGTDNLCAPFADQGATDAAELERLAAQLLVTDDLESDPGNVVDELCQLMDELTEIPVEALLAEWSHHDKVSPRVLSAFLQAHEPGLRSDAFSVSQTRDFLIEVFHATPQPGFRAAAAIGLARLAEECDLTRNDFPTELAQLARGLEAERTRHAALNALAQLAQRFPLRVVPQIEHLGTKLRELSADPRASIADRLLALIIHGNFGPADCSTLLDQAIALFASPTATQDDVADVLEFVIENLAENRLAAALVQLSTETQLTILSQLASQENLRLQWSDWRKLATDDRLDVAVRARLIDVLAACAIGQQWADLLDLARCPQLPLPIRAAVYRALWNSAEEIEANFPVTVLELLLNLGNDTTLVETAFHEKSARAYSGRFPEELGPRLLDRIRDQSRPQAYRSHLLRAIPTEYPLPEADLQLVLDQKIADIASLDEDVGHRYWRNVIQFARRLPSAAPRVFMDARIPLFFRCELFDQVPHETFRSLVRKTPFSPSQRDTLIFELGRSLTSFGVNSWNPQLSEDDVVWQEFVRTEALIHGTAQELYDVSNDPRYSPAVRWLAVDRLLYVSSKGATGPVGMREERSPLSAIAVAELSHPQTLAQRLIHRLVEPEILPAELPCLLRFVIYHAKEALADLLVSEDLPRERHDQIVRTLMEDQAFKTVRLSPPIFQRILAQSRDDTLRGWLLHHCEGTPEGEFLISYLRLASLPDISTGLRDELFAEICKVTIDSYRDVAADTHVTAALSALLQDFVKDTDALDALLLNNGTDQIPDVVTGVLTARIMAQLRDPRVPLATREELAGYIDPNLPLSESEHRLVIATHRAAITSALPTSLEDPWEEVMRHARSVPALARDLIANPDLPPSVRAALLLGVPRHTIFKYAALLADEKPVRADVADRLGRDLETATQHVLTRAIETDNEVWRGVLQHPAFLSEDPLRMLDVLSDPAQPRIFKEFAYHWVQEGDAHDQKRVLQASLDRLRDCDVETEYLVDLVTDLCEADPTEGDYADLIGAALASPDLPRKTRRAIIEECPTFTLEYHADRLWRALAPTGERELRGCLLARLCEAGRLTADEETRRATDLLRNARTPQEIAEAEQAWLALGRVGDVLSKSIIPLMQLARDRTQPDNLRARAIDNLASYSSAGEARAIARYLATRDGASLWDEAEADPWAERLRHVLVQRLSPRCRDRGFRDVLTRGPRHPIWASLLSFAQLPDEELVTRALRSMSVPPEAEWLAWQRTVPEIPFAARLATFSVFGSLPRATALVRGAFAALKGHHASRAELTDVLARLSGSPDVVRDHVVDLLRRCSLPENRKPTAGQMPGSLIQVLRFAMLEAPQTNKSAAGLVEVNRPGQFSSQNEVSIDQLARLLRQRVASGLRESLPMLDDQQLDLVLQETIAPGVLARHYQQVHPGGLPLLAQAIQAHLEGPEAWRHWRFQRPRARQQISYLDDEQTEKWSEDLRKSVTLGSVPEDIQWAAERIRQRFTEALHQNEIADEDLTLIADVIANRIPPAQRIAECHASQSILGRRLGGSLNEISEDDLAWLPPSSRDDLRRALKLGANLRERAYPEDRQALLAWRARLGHAIDLLRLLYCDERALARNALRAVGESTASGSAGAARELKRMRYSFLHPITRARRRNGEVFPASPLASAFDDAQSALQDVKTFPTADRLVAREISGFVPLIEIGHRPYGQGSCQSYLSTGDLNRALLAYVVDAMTKAIVISTEPSPGNPHGTPLARAIVRLGWCDDQRKPILVIERAYASAGEAALYEPLIQEAARDFAERRGWRAARTYVSKGAIGDVAIPVRIPASQNTVQYEDGAGDLQTAMCEGEYTLQVYELA